MGKTFSIDELRQFRHLTNYKGRPTEMMTDENWQREFELIKYLTVPYPPNIKKIGGNTSRMSIIIGEYDGETSWKRYCSYINGVLKNLKDGEIDYCYYIYQIEELLKFYPGTLRTRYDDGHWEVWLS